MGLTLSVNNASKKGSKEREMHKVIGGQFGGKWV